jgi:outer membrane protein OmpA-like peptidoglycan-associated protein
MLGMKSLGCSLLVTGLLVGNANAQDIQNFKPAAGTWNYLSIEGGQVAGHGEFVPSLVVNYGNQPLVSRIGGDVARTIVAHMVTADVMLTVGILDRLEITLDLPINYVTGDKLVDDKLDGVAVGDVRLIPKLRLFGLEKGEGFGAAIIVPVSLPTGDDKKFVGAGQTTLNPKLALEARANALSFAANGGVRVRPNTEEIQGSTLEIGTEVTYGAGVGINLGSEDVVLLTEVFGATPIADDVSKASDSAPLEALMGLRIFTDAGAVFTLGGGTGITADYGSPSYRIIGGFAWHDRNKDHDYDGILDDTDRCPEDPEDKDGFEDADGCPDVDNDNDKIYDAVRSTTPDENDILQYEAGPDQCPAVAEDRDGFKDEDGCPDEDNDQDKILDPEDKCPNEPETLNNWEDADGCPDVIPDTDKDGLLDPQDKCPKEPEDKDGFEDADGCPDPDNDKDGILDVTDKCPNEAEVVNGVDDTDGCPDQGLVKLTKAKIEILDKVFFDFNKATIKPQSFELLNQVAFVIKNNPQIKKIRVEGHTDNKGKAAYNLKLSQARADSVMKYLLGQGVDVARLESKGYGDQMPIEDNRTKAGQDANRRVEFVITEQE